MECIVPSLPAFGKMAARRIDIFLVYLAALYTYFIYFIPWRILSIRKRQTKSLTDNPDESYFFCRFIHHTKEDFIMKALREIAAFLKEFGDMFPDHMYIGK